jgi:hypothetical protein
VDKANDTGTQDGTAWASAFTTIQPAIDAAYNEGGGDIWVTGATYDERRSSPRADRSRYDTGSLVLKSGVHLYGGFAGTENRRDRRDWSSHISIIDGATSRDGEAAYHVVVGADNATIDGFRIQGGKADGPTDLTKGGGGMFNVFASPIVMNCTFANNEAGSGGGMGNVSSSPMIASSIFTDNTAIAGGGMLNLLSSPTVTNCIFTANAAFSELPDIDISGGAIFNFSSSPTVTNCTITANTAMDRGGGVYNKSDSSLTRVTNCIVWANGDDISSVDTSTPQVTFSNIGAGYSGGGEGNIASDPLFVDAAAGDFRLARLSSSIDTGTAVGAPARDITGATRPQGGGVDMGAYEFREANANENPMDVDGSLTVNAVDIQLTINGALGLSLPQGFNTDVNSDGDTDAVDVQLVVNAALGV